MASIRQAALEAERNRVAGLTIPPEPVKVRRECIAFISEVEVARILRAHFRSLNLPGYPSEDEEEQVTLELKEGSWMTSNNYVGEVLVRYVEVFNHG
jgi:hypothetical protein